MLDGHVSWCETTAVIARGSEIKTVMHWSPLCGRIWRPSLINQLKNLKKHQLRDPTDDTGQTLWNVIKTHMLISHFKENEILRNECLKDNDDKVKKKIKHWHHGIIETTTSSCFLCNKSIRLPWLPLSLNTILLPMYDCKTNPFVSTYFTKIN